MQEMAYNYINRSKIVYPTGQGQTSFKPDNSPWPPDYILQTLMQITNTHISCQIIDQLASFIQHLVLISYKVIAYVFR